MERRLAAILVADVVGYSRLVEIDETGTLAALKTSGRKFLNRSWPEDKQIVFLIGINDGDVVVEGDDIYGDSVGTAGDEIVSSLEGLGELSVTSI
jgi:adenylate cyclase